MSQPPQGGWGPQDSSAGQDGYGQGYGQPSPNSYGQGYDQSYGQPSADAYGQGSANSYGGYDASYGQGDVAGEQPKKGGAGKIVLFVCIGCAVLALIAGLIGGGIFLFTRGGDDGGQTQGQDQGQDDGGDKGGDTGGDDTDEGDGSDDGGDDGGASDKGGDTGGDKGGDTGATGGGTRDNPHALGDTFTINDGEGGTIDVQLGEVNWDATEAMMEANQFNDQPGEGERYILVPVTVTYHGDGSLSPAFGMHVEYVSSGGNSFSPGGVTPNSALDVGELYDGGNATYDLAYIVPDDAVQDGQFKAEVLLNFEDDPVWVAVK